MFFQGSLSHLVPLSVQVKKKKIENLILQDDKQAVKHESTAQHTRV